MHSNLKRLITLLLALTAIKISTAENSSKADSISSTVPFDYGMSPFLAIIPEMGAPPPHRSGIITMNTGVVADLFIQNTGLSLIDFDKQGKKKNLKSMSNQGVKEYEDIHTFTDFRRIAEPKNYFSATMGMKSDSHKFWASRYYKKYKNYIESFNETMPPNFMMSSDEDQKDLVQPNYYSTRWQYTHNRLQRFSRKKIKPGRRTKRAVKVCFTFIIFTFCKPDEADLSKIKDAIKSLQGDLIKLEAFVDAESKKTLLIANTMNKNFKKVDAEIGQLDTITKQLREIVVQVNEYAIRSHDESLAHFHRLIAEGLANGQFPASLIGNFSEVKTFRQMICNHEEFSDACNWGHNPLPYGMKNLAYGSMDKMLWVVGAFNFVAKGFTALKVYGLPHEIGGTCFKVQINYDRIVMSLNLNEIYWFDKETVVMEWLNNKGPRNTQCHRYLLMSAILGYKPYLNLVEWNLPPPKLVTREAEIVRLNSFFIEECTKQDSLLIILQDGCGVTSPMPGFQWDPKTLSIDYMGEILFTAKRIVDIPVVVPDLPYMDRNGTGYIDTSEWEKQINDEIERQKRDNDKTSDKIDNLKPKDSSWGLSLGLGLGFGTLFVVGIIILIVCCLCKANPGSRIMFIVALMGVLASASAEDVQFEKKTWFLNCASFSDISKCPSNGTYYINIIKTTKPPNEYLAEISKYVIICDGGNKGFTHNSGWIAGVAIALSLLIATMLATVSVLIYFKASQIGANKGVCYQITYVDDRDRDEPLTAYIKTQFIRGESVKTIENGYLCVDSVPLIKLIDNSLCGNKYTVTYMKRIEDADYKKYLKELKNGGSRTIRNPTFQKRSNKVSFSDEQSPLNNTGSDQDWPAHS